MSDVIDKPPTDPTPLTDAEVKQQIVNIVLSDQPDFTNTARIENIKKLLSKQTEEDDTHSKAQSALADALTKIATAVSTAATLGLVTATIVPTLPIVSLMAAFIGLVGSKAASTRIEQALTQFHRSDASTVRDTKPPH